MDYRSYKPIQTIKKSDRAEVIFAAVDGLDTPVVVKHLKDANPEIYRTIARLRSPHIPRIYFLEEQTSGLCVVEEYIVGRTLDVYLAEEELTDVQKLELCVQLCEALEALHQCEFPVIHRDVKPSNLLITEDEVLKLVDFDASRQYKGEKNTSDTRLLGTVEYAAPEQFGYTQTDVRSDVYSVGVVFSELKMERNAKFLKQWRHLIDTCTSFAPENRYKSITELKRKVLRCLRKAKNPLGLHAVLLATKNAVRHVLKSENTGEQGTEKQEEFVYGYETGSVSFLSDQLSYVEVKSVNYHFNANNSVSVCYERYLGELVLELPHPVYLGHCTDVTVKMKHEVGRLIIRFYDVSGDVIFDFYSPTTRGMEEITFGIQKDQTVTRIGFVVADETLTEYSKIETILQFIRFQFLAEETEELVCWFHEMTPGEYYNSEYTYFEDGRLHVAYKDLYGELKLALPQPVDLSRCIAVTVRLKSRVGCLDVKLYDESFDSYHPVERFANVCTYTMQDRWMLSSAEKKITGIGLMTNDLELTDYSEAEATLMNIRFHMKKE